MRVYIAGKLNDTACDYIKNVHKMIKEAEKVRMSGFSVFIPCLDILAGIVSGNRNYEDYFNNSQEWLDVADALYVLDNWRTSKGTKREIKRARQKNIPVFYSLEDLIKWKK